MSVLYANFRAVVDTNFWAIFTKNPRFCLKHVAWKLKQQSINWTRKEVSLKKYISGYKRPKAILRRGANIIKHFCP